MYAEAEWGWTWVMRTAVVDMLGPGRFERDTTTTMRGRGRFGPTTLMSGAPV